MSKRINDIEDPLHQPGGPSTYWSGVNLSEAVPGVPTPLGGAFWLNAFELSSRGVFHRMGALSASQLKGSSNPDLRLASIIYGRAVANVDRLRAMAGGIPGTSGNAMEEQLFGSVRPGIPDNPRRGRYPVVAIKMPINAVRLPGDVRRVRAETDTWWRRSITAAEAADLEAAKSIFGESARTFVAVCIVHGFCALLGQAVFDQVAKLARRRSEDLLLRLSSGYGKMAESDTVRDLWDVAHGRLNLDTFLRDHGYHAPNEGEMSSYSWREDPRPLDSIIENYRNMGEEGDPMAAVSRTHANRLAAEQELLASVGRPARPLVRLAMKLSSIFMPLREEGKIALLQAIDVGRAAARRIGVLLKERGLINEVDDVFYLSLDEVQRVPFDEMKEVIAHRRAKRDEYLRMRIPVTFYGLPELLPEEEPTVAGAQEGVVKGVGVSRGVASGRVRIVMNPSDCTDFKPGDILVCPMTDPGWAPLFMIAGALVTDIGGMLSHGALVARELGIPCIVNTQNGTRTLREGSFVVVDGTAGTVEVQASPAS